MNEKAKIISKHNLDLSTVNQLANDFAIYRKDKEIVEDLEKRSEDYLKQQKAICKLESVALHEQIKAKNKIENKLHDDILIEIASAQNDVPKK
jgi:hypothetical protein